MRMASIWTQAKKILCPRRPRGFQFMGFGRMMNPVGRTTTPVEKLLSLAGLAYLAPNTPYMFYPNEASRTASNRHYLYMPSSGGWVDPTTIDTSMGAMVGTLNADGTGGSLSYTPEIIAPTLVEGISILYTNTNVVVPILSLGFDRALTSAERTALSGLIAPIAAAAGVSAAACSLVTGQEFQQRCLKMKVNTALAGSANDSFVLPASASGTYAYTVDWGNGTREYVTANTSQTKDYDESSTFIVKAYGTYRPRFNDGGDKAKLLGLQIGSTNTTTMDRAFFGCSALVTLVGYADTSKVTNMSDMFDGCTTFNQPLPVSFSTAAVTTMAYMFYNCAAFNQSVANFNTAKVTSMEGLFSGCSAFKQSLATFNMAAVTTISNMLKNCDINDTGTTTNYDATLIAWAAQDLVNSKTLTATNCKYGDAGQTARTAIATDDLWTFVDGGHI